MPFRPSIQRSATPLSSSDGRRKGAPPAACSPVAGATPEVRIASEDVEERLPILVSQWPAALHRPLLGEWALRQHAL